MSINSPFGYARGLLVVQVIGDEKLPLAGTSYNVEGGLNMRLAREDVSRLIEERAGDKGIIINDNDVDSYVSPTIMTSK